MSHIRSLLPLLALLCVGTVHAQTDTSATGQFNAASHKYIKQDRLAALRTLDEALRKHPDDPRLLKLAEELLKEQQQQQEQQQQSSQSGQQQQQDQQQADQQKEQPKDQQQRSRPDGGQRTDPREAQRLLDALDQQEKGVQEKVRLKQRPARRVLIEKDW